MVRYGNGSRSLIWWTVRLSLRDLADSPMIQSIDMRHDRLADSFYWIDNDLALYESSQYPPGPLPAVQIPVLGKKVHSSLEPRYGSPSLGVDIEPSS